MKKTLVYIGGNSGFGVTDILRQHAFDRVYIFEPVPHLAQNLRTIFAPYPQVRITEAACAGEDGECEFHLTNNNNASASIGKMKHDFNADTLRHTETIKVKTIHLGNFLEAEGVEHIEQYLSDAQGMDLTILKTMTKYIEEKRIACIQTETTKDKYENIYTGIPPNNESSFREFLSPYGYKMVASGWGELKRDVFAGVPDDWWEFDSMWMPLH